MAKIQSVEPNIADLANGWLKSYKRKLKPPHPLQQKVLIVHNKDQIATQSEPRLKKQLLPAGNSMMESKR